MVALALGSDKSPGCSGEGRCVWPGTHSQPAYGHLPMVMETSLGARGVPGGHGLGARRARYSVLRFSGGRLRCPQTQGSLGILEGQDRVPLPPAQNRPKQGQGWHNPDWQQSDNSELCGHSTPQYTKHFLLGTALDCNTSPRRL